MEKLSFRVGRNFVRESCPRPRSLCTHLEQASKSLTRINNSNLGEGGEIGTNSYRPPYPQHLPKSPLAPPRRRHNEQTRGRWRESSDHSASVIARTKSLREAIYGSNSRSSSINLHFTPSIRGRRQDDVCKYYCRLLKWAKEKCRGDIGESGQDAHFGENGETSEKCSSGPGSVNPATVHAT